MRRSCETEAIRPRRARSSDAQRDDDEKEDFDDHADDAARVAMFQHTETRLVSADYDHYEISNYARPGYQSRHNRIYWTLGDFVMWDNRSVNHQACGGYAIDDIRLLHRTCTQGDQPF